MVIPQLKSECKLVYVAVESIKRCLSLCQLRLSKYPKCHELPQGLILLSCDMCSNRAIEKFFYHMTCEATVLFRSKIYSPSLCLSQASLICLQINSTSTKIPPRPHPPAHLIAPSDDTLGSDDRSLSRAKRRLFHPFPFLPSYPLPLPPYLGPSEGKKLIQSSHVRPNDTCPNKG